MATLASNVRWAAALLQLCVCCSERLTTESYAYASTLGARPPSAVHSSALPPLQTTALPPLQTPAIHPATRQRPRRGKRAVEAEASDEAAAEEEAIAATPSRTLLQLPSYQVLSYAAGVVALVIALQTSPLEFIASARAEHQLLFSTVGAFFMYASSDVISQTAAQRHGGRTMALDPLRFLRTGFISSLLSGFLAVFYFEWLDRAFPVMDFGGYGGLGSLFALLPILAKIAIDVGLYEPVYDTIYISLQALLRGDSVQTAVDELRKVPTVWRMAPRYWCIVDFVNFSCVSLRLRPLYNAFFSIPWSMYLTTVANSA